MHKNSKIMTNTDVYYELRKYPGSIQAVADGAGVSRNTVMIALKTGLPRKTLLIRKVADLVLFSLKKEEQETYEKISVLINETQNV